jgi:alkanesulfonate monooxygenase SsuD/methylene tetrahydromethanopterin reductase-like flavin-dependent oxidoreductase (luciferase family)
MKLGLSLPMFTADVGRPLAAASRAAASGYEGVFAPDHLFPPGAPDRPALDPYTILAAVAATHADLRVGTLVTRASLRPVGLLAKQAVSLHGMNRGGAIIGLGAGDGVSKPEHEAFGIAFPSAQDRLAILEETMLALRALFAGDPWEGGAHLPAVAGPLLPAGRPELWIGGRSDGVLAAAARTADAWNGWAMDAASFVEAAGTLRRFADGRTVTSTWGGIVLVGRDEQDLERLREERVGKGLSMELWQGTREDLRSFAGSLEEAGCTWLVVLPVGGEDRIDLVAEALRG